MQKNEGGEKGSEGDGMEEEVEEVSNDSSNE